MTRGRALALLALALVLSMTTWFSATAVIPQLRDEWGLSGSEAAWLTIAVQLGFVAGAVLSSLLNRADVLSPRLVILGGSIGAAAANVLVAAADGPRSALPLRALTGFFLAGVYPPARSCTRCGPGSCSSSATGTARAAPRLRTPRSPRSASAAPAASPAGFSRTEWDGRRPPRRRAMLRLNRS